MFEMVTIRPLSEEDYKISFRWRNNPKIWEYTGNKPDQIVTEEMEKQWLSTVLKRENEKRFAICLGQNEKYVGNIQLTSIDDNSAEYHVFIGEQDCWGKGVATRASILLLEFAFKVLGLKEIYLFVNRHHQRAIKTYEKIGFTTVELKDGQIKMIIKHDRVSAYS